MSTIIGVSPKINSLHYPLTSESENMEKELLKPFTYLTSVPGKNIRTNLIKVLAQWIPVAENKSHKLEEFVHYIHNASLLLDDIQDYSELRRGVPAAHQVYGITRTVIAVNYIQSRLYDLLDQFGDFELTKRCVKAFAEMFAGQGMELYWRDNHSCPTEEEYLQMIYRKTGIVFLIALYIANACSTGKKVNAGKFVSTLGTYFQINDDYQNLQNQMYFDSKGFCEDITEGKFSFLMVHAINNFSKEGEIIKEILYERTKDVDRKKECLVILAKCDSFEYTKKILKELKSILDAEVAKLDFNPLIDDFMQKAMVACL